MRKKVLPFPALDHHHAPEKARDLVREIIKNGFVVTTPHLTDQLQARNLDMADVLSVLRGGWVEEPEFENGAWRYKVQTNRQCVVVEFRSENEIVVVTAWRF